MEKRLRQFMNENQLIKYDSKMLVGVSGGPDSVMLLHFLTTLRHKYRLQLHAIVINHQLRGEEASLDVKYVEELCEKLAVNLIVVHVDVQAYKKEHRLSTQLAARELRYAIYREKMEALNADFLALGHHGDDQIETMIMTLGRTTHLSSLLGIPVQRSFASGKLIRPLLCIAKNEIIDYCTKNDLKPRTDLSNEDMNYTRNLIRKAIVPKLKTQNPNLHITIQKLNETLAEDEQLLQSLARDIFNTAAFFNHQPANITLFIPTLKNAPVSLQRRVFRLTLDYLYDRLPKQLSHVHEMIFLDLLKAETPNKKLHFPRELIMEKSYEAVHFYFQSKNTIQTEFSRTITSLPTELLLPNGARLIANATQTDLFPRREVLYCRQNAITFPLTIRTRRPGDRMRYEGLNGSKKIKDILIDEKIPRHKRDEILLLVDGAGEIIWLLGLRKKANLMSGTGPIIEFTYEDDKKQAGDNNA